MSSSEKEFYLSLGCVAEYLRGMEKEGVIQSEIRRSRKYISTLYDWLPEDKKLSGELLNRWRDDMILQGYSPVTVQSYVKGINRFLDYYDLSEWRFQRGHSANLSGLQVGYLTVVERVGKNSRNEAIWKCRCRCGNCTEVPATLLKRGKTTSCGCKNTEILKNVNQYIEGTSIRQSLEERIMVSNTSGFSGVARKRDKWQAFITYKGKRYHLGTFDRMEDAVKIRAEAKAKVQEDARKLLEQYDQ